MPTQILGEVGPTFTNDGFPEICLTARDAGPYLVDRQTRGLPVRTVGPAWADMNTYQAARPAGGATAQNRWFCSERPQIAPIWVASRNACHVS